MSKTIEELAYQENLSPFSELILGLSSAALHYLGEIPYGESEDSSGPSLRLREDEEVVEGSAEDTFSESLKSTQAPVNLELAKQNMDFIDILSVKTQGNLTPQESQILQGVRDDLKIKYSAQFLKAKEIS